MRLKAALGMLVILSLACGQYITPTPVSPINVTQDAVITVTPLMIPTSTVLPSPSASAQTAIVIKPVVQIHAEPDGVILSDKYLEAGQTVIVLEIVGDWAHIQEPDGWVWAGCLQGINNKGCEAK